MGWIRPQVLVGILTLTGIAICLILKDLEWANEGVIACIVGIASILPKLLTQIKSSYRERMIWNWMIAPFARGR